MDVPLAQALQLDGNHSPAERSRERVRQLLLVYGRTVSGVTGPVEFNKDPIGHPQWVIDPRQSEFELIITVK